MFPHEWRGSSTSEEESKKALECEGMSDLSRGQEKRGMGVYVL